MFVEGEPPAFDEVARWASEDIGYVVAIEQASVKRSGSDGFVPMEMDLRVTMPSTYGEVGYAGIHESDHGETV